MQTFLSEDTFAASARALDSKRLNKQLLEGRQMLAAMLGEQKGFRNHPATKMWEWYKPAFLDYLAAVKREMKHRGIAYENNWQAIQRLAGWTEDSPYPRIVRSVDRVPSWWANPAERAQIITTHRASLYHKDPAHYAQYITSAEVVDNSILKWVCCPARRKIPGLTGLHPCQYYWPTH